jgi:hypothetical protein
MSFGVDLAVSAFRHGLLPPSDLLQRYGLEALFRTIKSNVLGVRNLPLAYRVLSYIEGVPYDEGAVMEIDVSSLIHELAALLRSKPVPYIHLAVTDFTDLFLPQQQYPYVSLGMDAPRSLGGELNGDTGFVAAVLLGVMGEAVGTTARADTVVDSMRALGLNRLEPLVAEMAARFDRKSVKSAVHALAELGLQREDLLLLDRWMRRDVSFSAEVAP